MTRSEEANGRPVPADIRKTPGAAAVGRLVPADLRKAPGAAPAGQPETAVLRDGERIDDLERNGYRIIQNPAMFCFGMDAVLLSGFAQARRGERVIDLGTGTGIIPLLMEAKTEGEHFTGLEIQPEMADMAARSVALNRLQDRIDIVQGDIREASRLFGPASFDVVTSNPPYMAGGAGLTNPEAPKAVSRHEILCTFDDVARETARLLKHGGRFYLVHRPRRLPELFAVLRMYGLEPKRMKMVHPYAGRAANLVLLEAVRGGRPLLKAEAPVIVFRAPGVYSDEIRDVYGY